MQAVKRANWWVAGGLAFCLAAWGVGVVSIAKTAHIYAHRSPMGFRHDFVEHAHKRWVEVKQAVAAPAIEKQGDSAS